MRFNILCDIDWESKVDQPLDELSQLGYFEFFCERDYGAGLAGVTVGFICQNPNLQLKRRVRMSKKERKIYMDIMLDLQTMKAADSAERRRIIADRLFEEVPDVVERYNVEDFDTARFVADLRAWIGSIGWR